MKSSINLLVIDSSESLTNDIEKYFSSHEVINVVACKNNGEDALNYILNNSKNIDVILMDLLLPNIDGLYILHELKKAEINKRIIIMTSLKDDKVVDEVNSYGVDYYMLKPINFLSIEKRLLSMDINSASSNLFNKELMISELLHNLGIPSHVRGYQFIRDGILMMYQNNNAISYITKDIYPEIALKYNTTPSRVERAIRHAIEISWCRGDIDLMEEIFGNSLDVDRDKPTNSEYLSTISDRLKINSNLIYN